SRQHGGGVARRVGMRERAADRAAVTYLRISDQPGRVRENRAVLLHERVVLDVVMSSHPPDRQLVARVPHVSQLVDASDVHEQSGSREAQPQQGNQRMAPGEDLCVLTRAEQLDGVLDGLGDLVVERRRDHVLASSSARQTRSGVAGISKSVTPKGTSASTTAFITAAVEAMVPVSPTPFTPSGFVGLGVSVRPSSYEGSSA